jgi:hypothetical protein
MIKNINQKFLTDTSKIKLEQLPKCDTKYKSKELNKLLNKMINAFNHKLDVNYRKISLDDLITTFVEFNDKFNVVDSKFSSDVKKMDFCFGTDLKINNDIIKLNFIMDHNKQNTKLASVVIHAIHTFCYTFKYNYDGLTINICLDENKRELGIPSNIKSFDDKINFLQKNSLAFCTSGVTHRDKKTITVTRSEEIVKLLFHELVHYVGLDHELLDAKIDVTFGIVNKELALYETYAETMSILLNSAYQAIHLAIKQNTNPLSIYFELLCIEINYSVYLTANVLRFYDYDQNNFKNFFSGIGPKKSSPIATWEYIFLRTNLLQSLDEFAELVGPTDWRVTSDNKQEIIELMKTTDDLINKLNVSMKTTEPINNISYAAIEINY